MPLSLSGIRQKYPEYKDLSDKQLLDGLHSKFYSDMPRAAFDEKLGAVEPSIMGAGQPDQQVGQQVDQQEPQTAPQQATQDGMLSPLGQQVMGGISSAAGAVPKVALGAVQGAAQLGYGLGDLETRLMNKIMGTQMQAPKPDVFVGPTAPWKEQMPAKVGEFLGEAAPVALTGGAVGEGLIPQAAATGATAFLTQPGGMAQRGIAGAVGTAGGALLHGLSQAGFMTAKGLAGKLTDTRNEQKSIARDLYKAAFKGTNGIRPMVSSNTMRDISDLQEMYPTKRSFISKALDSYKRNPDLEGLHNLRSDMLKKAANFTKSNDAGSLDTEGKDALELLQGENIGTDRFVPGLVHHISDDLQKNMNNVSSEKGKQYALAQFHWRHNVVPFRTYKSVRALFGKEKEVSSSLYRDVGRTAHSANRIRDLLGTTKGSMQMGRFLHGKYAGIPYPLWLGGGVSGAYGLHRRGMF